MTVHEIPANLLPENEVARLSALHQYEILDTPAEPGFDTLAILAAEIFESEHAHICFIGQDHVFYKASHGSDAPITKDEASFYAAAPIVNEEGFVLGTIAVTDNKPHEEVTDQQLKMLQMLAGLVMEKLETRLAERKTAITYNERLRSLAHDIKNPVTSISLYAQLLSSKEMNSEKVFSMAARIENSSKRIEEKLNNLFI